MQLLLPSSYSFSTTPREVSSSRGPDFCVGADMFACYSALKPANIYCTGSENSSATNSAFHSIMSFPQILHQSAIPFFTAASLLY